MPDSPASPPTFASLKGCCPRCGSGKVFASWLQFKPCCEVCGFDLSQHDNGDAPVYLTICVIGGLLTVLACLLEYYYAPPYWLHAVLWLPFVLVGSILFLHYCKAWMLAVNYRHQHGQGAE